MVRRHRASHAINAIGQQPRAVYIGRSMPSSPEGRTHGQTTSRLTCNHLLWTPHNVERHRAWHAIIALGMNTQSDDVGRGMLSSPLYRTHDSTTSGMACYYRPWTTYTVRQNWTWHVIIAIEQIIWSDDVERGIPSSPLDNTQSDYIGRGMPSRSMGSTHN